MTDNAGTRRPPVLILDDERDMCELVADVGDDMGFATQWCDNFEDFACRYSIDLRGIFLDLAMPGMDGIEIIRFLGDNNSAAHLVLMSGHDVHVLDAARRLAEGRGLKVAGVLHKPFVLADLAALYDILAAVDDPIRPAVAERAASRYVPDAAALDAALAQGHVTPYFQPKFGVADRMVKGAEVLARWIDPDRGIIGPDQFIPLAEKEGLIERLTGTIIDQALDQCRAWRGQGIQPRIALNLSPLSLRNLDLPEVLLRKVTSRGLFPDTITLEITETALMSDYTASLDVLTRLRMRRFGLSIDDFGTGYSSLKQLQHGPFTELKVDQAFIAKALVEEGSLAIVESSVQLGHRLGMKVVAEGVETEAQMAMITGLGCEEAQGYLLGRPRPAEAFEWE
ncbi:EAL domain-containing protein [Magnetospirillum sp. SS-4]|uniref:EAL domain-containing response regulator n=1 Tax=Magnetospirillum sp. SS-4 TaxID=2681465 RepID=UPI00137D6030|nr:EAL domain-containing response regulator [Magnetospirillum sp. SS-4]CAA7613714.1 PvrR [Magnetospirillum sp. SS-4]